VVEVVDDAVSSAGVVVAVIGPHWLDARDRTGRRRLDDPNDFVRRELATALSRNTRVIPVLVDGAAMPAPEDLPSDLVPLSRRNALTLTPGDWRRDVDRLSSTIEVALAADRRGATLEAPTGAESAYGDERLTSLLKADHRLRRVRWIALGLAIVVLLAVAALLAVLAWYGDDASGPGTVAPVDPIYFAAGGRIFTVGSGGQNELFSGSGGDAEPDWSPDGERMAVARAGEIVVLGPGGEQLRPLTAGALNDDGPSWSPDGTLVAFDRQQSTGSSETDVWIVGMDGAAHNLTEGRRTGASPDWSPDERRIVFQRRGAIYLMRADGTAEERIQLDVAGTALDPAWSPDGAKIAFALSGDSGWNIYAYALDSRTLQNLTAGRVSGARSPAWSSDGDRIAFAADDGIWTVAADGTSLSKVVTGQGLEAPTWRPGTE
jgi:Tol biopolymer transport system component